MLCLVAILSTAGNGIQAREAFTINDGWQFKFHTDTAFTAVHLPHCWNEDAYHTRDYRRGTGIYEKQLQIPGHFAGQQIYLQIDGAATKSEIKIDGKSIGKHIGAYSSHIIDITPFVSPDSTHLLSVIVDNSDKSIPPYSADFTFMGGLYRDVWLIAESPVHFDISNSPAEGFKINPLLLPDGNCRLNISGEIINKSEHKSDVNVKAKLIASDGRQLAEKKYKLNIPPNGSREFKLDFGTLKGLDTWTPESPTLYKLATEIIADGKAVDSKETVVGFRSFGFDEDGRFLLNGKPYKLRGMCRHQDQRPTGIALTDEQHRRDIKLIKDMGANFIRISHYPQDDAVLEMCNRLGLIAWEEVPVIDFVPDDDAFASNSETMLREMIRRHYNHPSVAMWGYMNEILIKLPEKEREEALQRTMALARHLESVVREEDPTRFSTMAFHGSDVYNETGIADITDVKGWNLYLGWYRGEMEDFEKFMSRQHREHPAHRLIVSEYGAGSDLRLHSLNPERFDFSVEYQQSFLEHYLPVIEDSTFIAGASHWNFIDFSSANRAESMPHINNKGLVTNDRQKKDIYYFYCASWLDADTDTIAHIASRDWPERTEICRRDSCVLRPLKIYTNLPEVALSVNDVRLGVKKAANHTVVFEAPLREGRNVICLYSPDNYTAPLDATTIDMKFINITDGRIDLGNDELAINVGSNCYFRSDQSGLTWLPDREYCPGSLYGHRGGRRVATNADIALTPDTPLFQHNITGLNEYRIELLPGSYEVELGFANIESGENTMVRRRYTAETDFEGNLIIKDVPCLSTLKIRSTCLNK